MRTNNRIPVYVVALGFWLIFVVFCSFVLIQANTRLVALVLLAFTLTLAITNIFPFAGWLAAVASIVIYGLVVTNLNGVTTDALMPVGYFSLGVLILSGLVLIITRELNRLNFEMDNNQKLFNDLILYDPTTGLMRYQQALRLLKSEIIRCQRYKRKVCLLLIKIEKSEESKNQPEAEDTEYIKRQIAAALINSVRASDIPFIGNEYGAVLPETNLDGAKIVINRLINTVVNKVRMPINIGIAQFPEDGLTEVELSSAAEAALQHAAKTEKPVVQYSQIRNATKSGNAVPTNTTSPKEQKKSNQANSV
jgi:diguanylate cyclase (GGDEF)-like protein